VVQAPLLSLSVLLPIVRRSAFPAGSNAFLCLRLFLVFLSLQWVSEVFFVW